MSNEISPAALGAVARAATVTSAEANAQPLSRFAVFGYEEWFWGIGLALRGEKSRGKRKAAKTNTCI